MRQCCKIIAILATLFAVDGCSNATSTHDAAPSAATTHAQSASNSDRWSDDEVRDKAIISLVDAYLKAPIDRRFKYVIDGSQLQETMLKYYSQFPISTVTNVRNIGIDHVNDSAAIAKTLISMGQGTTGAIRPQYVRKQNETWLIDWRANVGFNTKGLKALAASASLDAVAMRLTVEITGGFPPQSPDLKETHYGIQLSDESGGRAVTYLERASGVGMAIFDVVRDGSTHTVSLLIQYTGREVNKFEVLDLISKNWFIER